MEWETQIVQEVLIMSQDDAALSPSEAKYILVCMTAETYVTEEHSVQPTSRSALASPSCPGTWSPGWLARSPPWKPFAST